MAQIDIAKTAFAGFSLIGRKPMAVLGWALFVFVLGVLPALAFVGPMMGNLAEMIDMAKSGAEPDHEHMMSMMTTMYAAHPILWITGLVTRVMLTGAIFRAVLEPSAGRWAYLRISMAEVMLALVVIVLAILVGLGVSVWIGVTVGVCIALWQSSHSAAIGVGILSGVVLTVMVIWTLLRFSLAAPMSFAEKNFRLFESWRVTRGHAFSLFLVALLVMVVLMVLQMLFAALVMTVLFSVAGVSFSSGAVTEASIEAFFSQPVATWMPLVLPWAAGIGLLASLVGAIALAIATAPWAEAYRQLNAPAEPAV